MENADLRETDRTSAFLKNRTGWRVCRLSRAAVQTWKDRFEQILEIRVTGLIVRTRDESDPKYLDTIRCDRWLIPLVEITAGRPVKDESPKQVSLI